MSSIPKSKRAYSQLESSHKAIMIRKQLSFLMHHNFHINISKMDDMIQQDIRGREPRVQEDMKQNAYKYYRTMIDISTKRINDIICDIIDHLQIANSIYPTYKVEFDERRLELDKALGRCNALKSELQYVGECLYSDIEKYRHLIEEISELFLMIKSLRKSDNRFLKSIQD